MHTSEQPVRACVKGGLIFGADQGLLEDADLSSLSAAKTAVAEDVAKLHTSQKTFGPRVTGSLDAIGDYDATYLTGTDVDKASMLAISTAGRGRSTRF